MNINRNTSHPSAFISSTFIDLKAERKAVAKVLDMADLNINALDTKPASNDSSKREIIKGIRESDFFILIVGSRYGSVLPKMTGSEHQSITWWEYTIALKENKPVLVYFKEQGNDDDINFDDRSSPDFEKNVKKLKIFKHRLSEKHNPKYFSNADELAQEIDSVLISVYRNGISGLLSENERLLRENEELKKQLNQPAHNLVSPTLLDIALKKRSEGIQNMLNGGQNTPNANPLLDALKKK